MVAEYFRLKKGIPRSTLAMKYLRGSGIEIGALHNPVFIGPFAKAKYVDRMSTADLMKEYPELSNLKLVEPNIIDNAEVLSKVPADSLDFIIANHFIEHCEDPIQTLKNFSGKLRNKGIIYLAVPDKHLTFDKHRSSTSFEHLVQDHTQGVLTSREKHYEEWVQYFGPKEINLEDQATFLQQNRYSIHFHVWSKNEFLDFLEKFILAYKMPLKVVTCVAIADEAVFILQKSS